VDNDYPVHDEDIDDCYVIFHVVSSTFAVTNYIYIYFKISVTMYVNMLPCTDYSSNNI